MIDISTDKDRIYMLNLVIYLHLVFTLLFKFMKNVQRVCFFESLSSLTRKFIAHCAIKDEHFDHYRLKFVALLNLMIVMEL